jgi:predicted alpha/beta-fold hydrolase
MLKSSSLCLYSSNVGTFWLKIKQFWPFEEISIFSHGGHLGYLKKIFSETTEPISTKLC